MIKNVIFDWSGTLSDDLSSVHEAAMHIFDHYQVPRLALDEYRREFELPYMRFYERYLPDPCKDKVCDLFLEKYATLPRPTVYPCVLQVLQELHEKEKNLLVLSSVFQSELEDDANRYELAHLLHELNGSVYDKTITIHELLDRNQFSSEETCFVGDMEHDLHAGQSAGVLTIGICWGYQSREKLAAVGPDHLIDNIQELLSIVM